MIEAHFAIAFNGTRAKDREARGHFAASFVAEVCVSNARGAYPRASAGEALKFARDELPPASLRVDQQPDASLNCAALTGLSPLCCHHSATRCVAAADRGPIAPGGRWGPGGPRVTCVT